jgi:hypothetical protein
MTKTTTTTRSLAAMLGLFLTIAVPAAASAHGGRDIDLHVGGAYGSCYFDLHSELTKRQFRTFAAEAGQLGRFRPVSGAGTLGPGNFEIDLGYAYFFLDDAKGAWNNTMSHPQSDHYLGEELGIPYLALRVGLTDRIDGELYGTLNPGSNYGLVGLAAKIRLIQQDEQLPVAVAIRPSASALLGPSEVQVYVLSTDVIVSRNFHGLEPFVGAAVNTSAAIDNSDDTDVGHQSATRAIAFAGVDYNWRFLSIGAQAEVSDIVALDMRVGGRF